MEENKNAELKFDKPVWNNISIECKELIQQMTEKDPENRISYQNILEHKVFESLSIF